MSCNCNGKDGHEHEHDEECHCGEDGMEQDPLGSWGEAFEEAYFQLQVEAMKKHIKTRNQKTIDKIAEAVSEYMLEETYGKDQEERDAKLAKRLSGILAKSPKK